MVKVFPREDSKDCQRVPQGLPKHFPKANLRSKAKGLPELFVAVAFIAKTTNREIYFFSIQIAGNIYHWFI